jgi:hypothetical protein
VDYRDNSLCSSVGEKGKGKPVKAKKMIIVGGLVDALAKV